MANQPETFDIPSWLREEMRELRERQYAMVTAVLGGVIE